VVDAGGQGLYVMFQGALNYLRGEEPPELETDSLGAIDEDWLAQAHSLADDGEPFGYCTELVVTGSNLSVQAARGELEAYGRSLLVVGDEHAIHLHVHTKDPGRVLSYASALGPLSRVKVDNMELQHQQLAGQHVHAGPISVVAVGVGQGIIRVLRDVGATTVVEGGQTMNPSTATLVEAIKKSPTDSVIVLPNNKNIVMAARQAAELSDKEVHVIETRSVPQGIAALIALNQDATLEENAEAMTEAVAQIHSGEVCAAVRTVSLGQVDVREGDYIAIVDGELIASQPSVPDAVKAALERLVNDDTSLTTLYPGEDVSDDDARALATELEERYGGVEVQVVRGDQPYYDYFLSAE
jgi:uncharacterized protein